MENRVITLSTGANILLPVTESYAALQIYREGFNSWYIGTNPNTSTFYISGGNVNSQSLTIDSTGNITFKGGITALGYNNTNWDTAYTNRITSLTSIGSSGPATLINHVLNIPDYSAGGISGSGTTNYITKFTGTSSLGNSILFDNGTNVGIGTTSPSYKLEVIGTGRFLNSVTIAGVVLDLNSQGGGTISSGNSAGNNLGPWLNLNGPVYLNPSTGNNGMFAINGQYYLQSGNSNFNHLSLNPTINTTGTYAGNIRGLYYNPTLTSTVGVTHRAIETTSGNVVFNDNIGNQNVTISKNNVYTNHDRWLYLKQTSAYTGNPEFGLAFSSYCDSSGGNRNIEITAVNAVYADFIGNWNFNSLLSVNAGLTNNFHGNLLINQRFSNNIDTGIVLNNTNNTYAAKFWRDGKISFADSSYATDASVTAKLFIKSLGTTSGTTALLVQNSSSTNLLSVLDNSNVGIGKIPSYPLDVAIGNAGNINSAMYVSGIHSDGRAALYGKANTNIERLLYWWHTGGFGVGTGGSLNGGAVSFSGDASYYGPAHAMYFMNTIGGGFGPLNVKYRLGITTSTTNTTFDSGVSNNLTNIESNTFTFIAKSHTFYTGTTTGNQSSPNQYTPLHLSTTGNVGIGTISPSNKLEVTGTSFFNGLMSLYAANGQANISVYNAAYAVVNSIGTTSSGDGVISQKNSSAVTTTQINSNGYSYFNGGNVGIGTTSPSYSLDIQGTTSTTSNVVRIYPGSNAVVPTFMVFDGSEKRMVVGANSSGGNSYFTGTNGRANLAYAAFFGNAAGYATQIGTYSGVNMTLLDNGNVGIGTATPSEKLHVIGNIISSAKIEATTNIVAGGTVQSGAPAGYASRAMKWGEVLAVSNPSLNAIGISYQQAIQVDGVSYYVMLSDVLQ